MLKNIVPYRLLESFALDAEALAEALDTHRFNPCGRSDPYAQGFVPVIPELDALTHAANGCIALMLREEEKILPASVVRDELNERVAEREHREHRKIRKREKDALKDEIVLELLPRAFSRFKHTLIVIDAAEGFIYVDAASYRQSETALEALREAIGSLPVAPLSTEDAPASVMTDWLSGNPPREIELGESVVLEDPQTEGARVTIRRLDLHSDQVREHLAAGLRVQRLSVNYDERLSATLDADYSIKQFQLSDVLAESGELAEAETEAQRFDAEFALRTLEARAFLKAVLALYGGEARS